MDKDPEHQGSTPGNDESKPDALISPDTAPQETLLGETVEPAKQEESDAKETAERGTGAEAAPVFEAEETNSIPRFIPRGKITKPSAVKPKRK